MDKLTVHTCTHLCTTLPRREASGVDCGTPYDAHLERTNGLSSTPIAFHRHCKLILVALKLCGICSARMCVCAHRHSVQYMCVQLQLNATKLHGAQPSNTNPIVALQPLLAKAMRTANTLATNELIVLAWNTHHTD